MLQTSSVHFLFLVFIGMLILTLLLIISVIIYGFFQYKDSLRNYGWMKIINQKISEVIVYEEDEIPLNTSFIILSAKSAFRNLFLHQLVDSEKKFSGTAKNKIKNLFDQYNLQREAVKKLNQKKSHLIAGGIRELTVMDAKDAHAKIADFLSHPSSQVYQEAQYALVRFNGFKGLDFLSSASDKISEWQQLRLLLSITQIPENSGDSIEVWLRSSNDSVIIFTLKLIRKFRLLSFYSTVIDLLDHASVDVRIDAVQTLLSIENSSTIQYLTEIYPYQPLEVQLEILRIMKISKDHCCTDMLKKELSENNDTGIKVLAAETLFSLGQQEYLLKLSQDETLSEELIQITKYALRQKVC